MDWDDILEDYSLSCGFMHVSVFCVAFHFLVYHAVILHHVRCSARRVADDGLAQPQILDPNHRFHHFPCLNMFEPFPRFYRVLHRLAPSCTCEVSEWQQRSWGQVQSDNGAAATPNIIMQQDVFLGSTKTCLGK